MKLPWQPCTEPLLQHYHTWYWCCYCYMHLVSFGGPFVLWILSQYLCNCIYTCLYHRKDETQSIIMDSCLCARQGVEIWPCSWHCWLDLYYRKGSIHVLLISLEVPYWNLEQTNKISWQVDHGLGLGLDEVKLQLRLAIMCQINLWFFLIVASAMFSNYGVTDGM